jgi:hypothetical protein
VATDPWYVRELVADVPPEEMEAALTAEDWMDEEAGEDGDEDEEEGEGEEVDSDYSEEEVEEEDDGTDSLDAGTSDAMESDVDPEAACQAGGSPKLVAGAAKDA